MNIERIVLEECEGVYSPAEDTHLLLQHLKCGGRVLEIGSGSGLVSIACAISGSEVDSADINPGAVKCTASNAELNGASLNTFVSDLFSNVPEENLYDSIIFNPPYLPVEDDLPEKEQWSGGNDGFKLTRPFLEHAKTRLLPGGEIYTVLSSQTDIESLKTEFSDLSFHQIAEESYFFEKILVFRITSKE